MEELLAFFGEFIVIIAVAGMFLMIAPEGGQKKYIRFAISLCVLASLIGPMLSVVSSLPDMFEEAEFEAENEGERLEEDANDLVIEESRKNIEKELFLLLSERYRLDEESLSVSVVLDASDIQNIQIRSVNVQVSGMSHVLREDMKRFLKEEMKGYSEIYISEKEGT